MDFVAIDFETANFKRNSACSVGIAKVQDGRIVETWSSFIRPASMHFEPRCVAIHGITEKDVESAPMFGDIWASQLERIVACNPVVAHNAGFDLSVLRACCEEHGIPFAKPASACTLKLARRLLPELPNHRLDTIARHLGVQLTHHEAESDAAACAEVAAEFCRMTNASSILEVESLPAPEPNPSRQVPVSMDMDEGLDSGIGPVVRTFDRGAEGIAIFIGWPYAVRHDVRGTSIVLTGKFAGLPRKDAIELLQEEGATVKSSVSRKTDILVVADKLWDAWQRGGYTTGKLSRALELREEGHRIQILAASDLFRIW